MKMYVGTYSNSAIIAKLRKQESKLIWSAAARQMSDNEIVRGVINAGLVSGLTFFFAPTLQKAKTTAAEMGLKNFSAVSATIYEQENNFE